MRNTFLIAGILVFHSLCCIAQGIEDPSLALAQLRKDIIAHSPEAEALGKYGVLPVTLYTGMPEVSVPVYEIKMKGLSLPISLSYNYNGYKPNEVPTWVGLGWSLQGIGSIVRTVKGEVDESMTAGNHFDDYVSVSNLTWNQAWLTSAGTQGVDAEPDIYIFNVGGHSGKFIFIKGKAYLFPHQQLQITTIGSGFKIVDDKGITYIFNDIETTYHKTIAGSVPVPTHNSAWYVSQIISADQTETINFSYSSFTYKQPDTFMDSYTIDGRNAGNTGSHTHSTIYNYGDHITALLPISITTNKETILFSKSTTDRTDLTGSTGGRMLDAITITSNLTSSYQKQVMLNHEYFGSTGTGGLKLKSLFIKLFTPTAQTFSYNFDYLNENSTPADKMTMGIDIGGYYNGALSNAMLFPSGYFTPTAITYANRTPNITYGQYYILNKITYPTGGYTILNYEQNRSGQDNTTYKRANQSVDLITTYNANNQTGGVTTLTQNFSIDVAQYVKVSTFMHLDGTDFPSFPILHMYDNLNNEVFTSPLLTISHDIDISNVLLQPGAYHYTVSCPSTSNPTEGRVDYTASVPDVVANSLADVPGLRIKTITSYDNSVSPAKVALVKQYTYSNGVMMTNSGITSFNTYNNCSDFNVINLQASVASPLSDLSNNQFYYKQVTEQTQDANQTGKTVYTFDALSNYLVDVNLTSKTDYKSTVNGFLPVHATVNQYQYVAKRIFNAFKVKKSTVIGPVCSGCLGCPMLQSPDDLQAADLLQIYTASDFYSLPSSYTRITSTTETNYDIAGAVGLQKQVNYFYDNTDEIYPTRTVVKNSQVQDITSTIKYPLDYQLGGCQTRTSIETAFDTDLQTAVNTQSTAVTNLRNTLVAQGVYPYHGNTPANQSTFTSIVNQYHIVNDFKANIATATNNRNSAWTNYLSCTDAAIAANSIAWQKALLTARKNNVMSQPIETYVAIHKENGNDYILGATRNESAIFTSGSVQVALPAVISQIESDETILNSSFIANPDNYYKTQLLFGYDTKLNVASQKKNNDVNNGYLWNYQNAYPVAQIVNAPVSDVAYTSFEGDDNGGWTFTGTKNADATAPTGINSYLFNGTNPITRTGLTSATTYIVSYWTNAASAYTIVGTIAGYPIKGRSYNGWTYYEHKITGQTSISITGSTKIDELRLYPDGSQMTTYTYEPLMGMSGQCDVNSKIIYYKYDGLARLKEVRDQDGNLVKTIDYHYQTQTP